MRHRIPKVVSTGICALTVLLATCSPSHAGWLWHALFGPHYGPVCCPPVYSAAYGPVVDYGFYGPAVDYGFSGPPVYGPGPCCPAPIGGVAVGAAFDPCCPPVGVPGAGLGCPLDSPGWRPPQQPGPGPAPRTFQEEEPADRRQPAPANEGFGPREEPGAAPAKPPAGDAFDTETFRVPAPGAPESEVPRRQPAPTPPAVEDPKGTTPEEQPRSQTESNAEPAPEPEPGSEPKSKPESGSEPESNGVIRVPALELDQKLTWKAAPSRTRLAIRANFSNPVVARNSAGIGAKWTPAPHETKLVRK